MRNKLVKKMPRIKVNESFCKGCGICMEFCPMGILKPSEKPSARGFLPPVVVDEGRCTCCRICEFYCPDFAIYVIKEG
jgi:2-oxoglutarate ferredoxin oxidoreductase subunit delta